ncbi:MAG: hypothetical protein HY689_00985 [Chloroflexi bacterium]|nr:hypothetical protein [Chloroflexota bacterium]
MQERGFSERHVEAVLARPAETFIGESTEGAWVYHRRLGRKNVYVLVEPYPNPDWVVISVMPWKPGMVRP